jgi:cytochrome c-type biogenesis protein CcmH
MILWTGVALMTAVAIAAVLWPLWRPGRSASSGSDVAVYRDQMQEIERDRELGLIGAREADAARIEVSRRIIAASASDSAPANAPRPLQRHAIAALALVLLTAGAAGLYLRVGAPGFAVTPAIAADSAAAQTAPIDKLVAQAEAYLAQNPNEPRGWETLAPVYMRLGRYADAVNAWQNVLRLAGPDAERLANLGESLMAEANGIVTDAAKDAFVKAVALDPKNVAARYYVGIAAEQDGRRGEAAKLFKELIADAPAGAHWVADVQTALARVEGKPDGLPGPSPSDMLAASKETPAQAPPAQAAQAAQDPTVRAMVDRLAQRLQQDGSDVNGWVRLVHSYKVLGDEAKQSAAIADARKSVQGDAEKSAKLEAAVKAIEAGENPSEASAGHGAGGTQGAAPPQHDAEAMVARLAERLKRSGGDPEGWVMLVRSYATLNAKDKIATAIGDARSALAAEPDKLAWFNQALDRLHLESVR